MHIQEAVQLLDERLPGWRDEVDVDELDMSSNDHCILGQLFGEFNRGRRALKLAHGTGLTDAFCGYQAEWVKELRPREACTLTLTPEQADLLLEITYSHLRSDVSGSLGVRQALQDAGACSRQQLEYREMQGLKLLSFKA